MKILTVSQMAEVDRLSSEQFRIPGLILMENAGIQCFLALEDEFSNDLEALRIVVVCGKGNNGGDGMVLARQLLQRDVPVEVYLLGRCSELKGDAAVNAGILLARGHVIQEIVEAAGLARLEASLDRCDVVVDALLGTGLSQPLKGNHALAVEAINRTSAFRLAVDIPSGMFADSVLSSELSVWADRTVTFTAPKIAHVLSQDLERLGRLDIVPIGSPPQLLANPEYFLERIEVEEASRNLLSRPASSYKGSYGHLLVLAGSRGKSGAAAMAAGAALRTGTGLVTVALPHSIQSDVAAAYCETMTEGLAEDEGGALDPGAWERLQELLEGKTALAVGPGISLRPGAGALVRRLLQESSLPVVLDAGGVDALTGHLGLLGDRQGETILTPHPGEFSRLTGIAASDIASGGIHLARDFARNHRVWLVLKGFRSILAGPDGSVQVCPLGNPGMATAGMGDVLTGVIGGLLAAHAARRNPRPAPAAATAGLYLHSLAGDLAAEQVGQDGMIAGDVIDCLPEALSILRG